MTHSLHLLFAGHDFHVRLPDDAQPAEVLAMCVDAMREGRVAVFSGALPPRATRRSDVVINFARVGGAWIETEG